MIEGRMLTLRAEVQVAQPVFVPSVNKQQTKQFSPQRNSSE